MTPTGLKETITLTGPDAPTSFTSLLKALYSILPSGIADAGDVLGLRRGLTLGVFLVIFLMSVVTNLGK